MTSESSASSAEAAIRAEYRAPQWPDLFAALMASLDRLSASALEAELSDVI